MTDTFRAPPRLAYRLIPSHSPPIELIDTVATVAVLAAVMDLFGRSTIDVDRIAQLSQTEWVYGTPDASIVVAAFTTPWLGRACRSTPSAGPDEARWQCAGSATETSTINAGES